MTVINTQNKRQKKRLKIVFFTLSRDVNTLQILKIMRKCQWNTDKSRAHFIFGINFNIVREFPKS